MQRAWWMGLVCLLLLAWAQIAWGADGSAVGGMVRPLGVGDVSVPVALLMIWSGIKTRWDETIGVYRERAKAEAAIATEISGLTRAIRERGGPDDA